MGGEREGKMMADAEARNKGNGDAPHIYGRLAVGKGKTERG